MRSQRLDELTTFDDEGRVRVVVESPRGSRAKLVFDPELGAFVMKRALPGELAYPYDWGFVAGTKAEDGDPLDAMVLHELPSWPGMVIPCRPLALSRIAQCEKPGDDIVENDRVICVPDVPGVVARVDVEPMLRGILEATFLAIGSQTHA